MTARFDRDGLPNPPSSALHPSQSTAWQWQLLPGGRLYSYGYEGTWETGLERRLSLFAMPGSDADPDWLLRNGFEASR